jgi:hypothetical protein
VGPLPADKMLIAGIGLSILAFTYCYLIGSVLRTPRLAPDWRPGEMNPGAALLDAVIVTACGMALLGFATFVLGLASLIYPLALAVLLVAFGVLAGILGDSPLKPAFWARRGEALKRAVSPGALLVFASAVYLAYPALLPDPGSDATVYHHAYAFDWATAHRIYVDPWIRGAIYANNWLLLVTWVYSLHGPIYVLFLNWLTGTLSLLGIYGYVTSRVQSSDRSSPTPRDALLGIAAVTMLVFTPEFLTLYNSSYLDVPFGCFFLAFAAASLVAVTRRARFAVADAVVLGSFLVGMKISFIALLPLVVAAVAMVTRRVGLPRRTAVAVLLACLALSSPWYVRNFIVAGDPVSPVLNLKLHGVDGYYSLNDYLSTVGSIGTAKTWQAVLSMPFTLFWHPEKLEGFGMSLVIVLLWAPALLVGYALVRGKPVTRFPAALAGAFLLYAYAYWMLTSNFERYAMLFIPLFCAFIVSLFTLPGLRSAKIKWVVAIAMFALATPSPAAISQYQTYRQTAIDPLRAGYDGNRDAWLATHTYGYRAIEYITRALQASGRGDLRVYRLNFEIGTLFFKLHGLDSIGEWSGPQRYRDFAYAIDHDDLKNYLARFRVGVVMIPPPEVGTVLSVDELDQLDDELTTLGYRRVTLPGDKFITYFSPEIGPLPPLPRPPKA